MKEKDIQKLFGQKNKISGVFELKLVKKKSMPFNAIEPHQYKALYKAKNESLYHKISDMSAGQKPFDCFNLSGIDAYAVLVWYIPRVRKTAYYIPINTLVSHRDNAERKSITEETASFLSEYILSL